MSLFFSIQSVPVSKSQPKFNSAQFATHVLIKMFVNVV